MSLIKDVYHCFWRHFATYRIQMFDCDSFRTLRCVDDFGRIQVLFVSSTCEIDNLRLQEACILTDAGFGHMPAKLPELPPIDSIDVVGFAATVSKCRKDILEAQQFSKESSVAAAVSRDFIALSTETSPTRLNYKLKRTGIFTKLKAVHLFCTPMGDGGT